MRPDKLSIPESGIISMGVMNTLDPVLVKRSYEIGVRHFDTAAVYARGRTEEMLGSVIKGLGARESDYYRHKDQYSSSAAKYEFG